MKKIFILAAVILCVSASCEREKFCKCTTVELDPQPYIVNVDYSMSCKAITQIGVEHIENQTLVREMVNVKCERVVEGEDRDLR